MPVRVLPIPGGCLPPRRRFARSRLAGLKAIRLPPLQEATESRSKRIFPYTRLVGFARSTGWGRRCVGVLLIAAGIILVGFSWWRAAYRAKSEAQRILSALGAEEEPSERSALALVALAHSDHEVRVAFLRAALGSGNGLGAIESREQGISVALSQVDYSEAVS